MGTIRITPEELKSASGFLMQKLEIINTEVAALKSKIDEVAGNWEGSAQSSFIDSFEGDMYPILSKTLPEVITGLSEQLKGAAITIEKADLAIATAFRG